MGKCRICIVCVCFNAYEDASKLLSSISEAYSGAERTDLVVVLSDNSTDKAGVTSVKSSSYSFKYYYHENVGNIGYFPAFHSGFSSTSSQPECFDYVIVSNVDLVLAKDFFKTLEALDLDSNVGVVAPAIISMSHGGDQNPKMIDRPTKKKIEFMLWVCSSGFTFLLHRLASSMRDKLRSKSKYLERRPKGRGMYGAHGAFIVFTKRYFECGGSIDYPRFLFGEEGFVAEETLRAGLTVQHVEALVVNDREHGSTSLKSSKFLALEHRKSYEYYLNRYF